MRKWSIRPEEVRNLMNPAFCGRVIYAAVVEYQKKTTNALPFPLIYLILPFILPKQTREKISSRSQLINWIQNNQALIYNFGKRANDLVVITNEALEFMLQAGYLRVTDSGAIENALTGSALSKTKNTDCEVKECITKAENVARWFAATGKVETIYICLGVRP